MNYNQPGTGDLSAQTITTGTVIPFVPASGATPAGCTLAVNTYYFALGSQDSVTPAETALTSVSMVWQAAVAATITVETTNCPKYIGGTNIGGGTDISDFDVTAAWQQQNPSTAYVPVSGSGNTVTNLTVTAGGTNAGGCSLELGNLGDRRVRIKIVTTVGGVVRCTVHGKAGS
jgi:hypothetical protein